MTEKKRGARPETDLVIERDVAAPVARVWDAWTIPEQLRQWWCPRPWTTPEAEIDLRPGGSFSTLLRGPAGEEQHVRGCYLEVVPRERLVWTIALRAGYRPAPISPDMPHFTAVIEMRALDGGTKYRATVMHRDAEGAAQHEKMGFFEGWGVVTDQLAELVTRRGA